MNPGKTVLPPRSTYDSGRGKMQYSSLVPTAKKRLAEIATAWARDDFSSTVKKFPL
jgi:hypothetical protein